MRSFFQKKLWIILLAALALGALTVLADGLDQLSFNESQRFVPSEAVDDAPVSIEDGPNSWADIPLWKQIVAWSLVALLFILVGLLLSPELRKRFFTMLIRGAFTAFGIYFLLKNYGDRILGLQNIGWDAGKLGEAENAQPMPVFEPPQISSPLSYIVSFAVALLWLVIMWGLYQGWKKYSALNAGKPLDQIARIARSSLHDLSSGRDSSDVIINCYLRMGDVVADKRQLRREVAMTPREFALRLEKAGLPGDAVRRLTRLFEAVRYGDHKSGPKDVNEAVNCLNTILHYCGEAI